MRHDNFEFIEVLSVFDSEILELPGDIQNSDLQYFTPNPDQVHSVPKRMAWMTAAGVYHGSLKVAEADSEDHIDNAQLLPYPSLPGLGSEDFPLSLSLTEFHFLLLFKDRIIGICNLNDHIAYEEQLPLVCLSMPIYHEQADDLYIYIYIYI